MQSLKAALSRSHALAQADGDPFAATSAVPVGGQGADTPTDQSIAPGLPTAACADTSSARGALASSSAPERSVAARFASFAAHGGAQSLNDAGVPGDTIASVLADPAMVLRADAPSLAPSFAASVGTGIPSDQQPQFLRRRTRPSAVQRLGAFASTAARACGLSIMAGTAIILLSVIAGKPLVTGADVRAGLDRLAVAAGYELRQVAVTGYRPNTSAQVFAFIDAGRPVSLIGYDRQAARERLRTLRWVADVEFTAELPDTLHITVLPKMPVAIAVNDPASALHAGDPISLAASGAMLVASDGTPLGSVPTDSAGRDLLVVTGTNAAPAALTLEEALRDAVWLRDVLAVAERIGERRWDLHLRNGMRVALPDIDGRPDTWLLATRALSTWRRALRLPAGEGGEEADPRGLLALIDVRNPSRPVLRYRQPATPARVPGAGFQPAALTGAR